jgi:DNA-binding NtrC family response regulator
MARILLIDDEPDLLEAMREALCNASHDVTAISNGSYVVRGDTGIDFDLVITDIIMPETEGIETLTYLNRHNPEMRVIAISGGGSIDASFHLRMAERLGAFRTLGKPFALRTLVETVEETLSRDHPVQDPGNAPNPLTFLCESHSEAS